ncbi:carbohydrate ABC transporter permease [Paenibacillus sp. HB172176]|uniref:carbohydrate ABC transporter permease n=1 Tax=Paenibacillus sp. HB172176 TaxID=2493690 RepID=UPI00143AF03D|nr:carbohydrate ABC transporter permease [Paenibacillus sp. HB172176]
MLNQKSISERVFDVSNTALMIIIALGTLYPLLYVLFASFSSPMEVMQNRGLFLYPKDFTLEAYRLVFHNPNIKTAYINTMFYVVVGTVFNIFMTSLGAYALSRRNLMWKNAVMFMIVFTMFFEGGLIPVYILIDNLGMINTRWALIIPTAVSAFNLIIMRTSFQTVPVSLEESARIDGANDWTILFRIILPLSLPVVAVMVLFYGVFHWNSWFSALIYLQSRDLYPMQLILREILITNDTENMLTGVSSGDKMPIGETVKYATIIISTIPILFLYPFLQRYFVKGVMIGAIKE